MCPVKAFFQWLSATDWFMRVGPRIVPRMDRVIHRLTRGKLVTSSRLIPALVLYTVGAKSGAPRESPLACLPESDDSLIVVGSNFGRPQHPGWSANLIKTPQAEVSFRGRRFPVTATLLEGEARADIWPALMKLWPNYDIYTEKSGRHLRVFRLTRNH